MDRKRERERGKWRKREGNRARKSKKCERDMERNNKQRKNTDIDTAKQQRKMEKRASKNVMTVKVGKEERQEDKKRGMNSERQSLVKNESSHMG